MVGQAQRGGCPRGYRFCSCRPHALQQPVGCSRLRGCYLVGRARSYAVTAKQFSCGAGPSGVNPATAGSYRPRSGFPPAPQELPIGSEGPSNGSVRSFHRPARAGLSLSCPTRLHRRSPYLRPLPRQYVAIFHGRHLSPLARNLQLDNPPDTALQTTFLVSASLSCEPPTMRLRIHPNYDAVATHAHSANGLPKGTRVISRINTSWCECGEIGLVIHIEAFHQKTAPEYWILFEHGGLALWPLSVVRESFAISTYIDPTAQAFPFTTAQALRVALATGLFRF